LVALLCWGFLVGIHPAAASGAAGWRIVDIAVEPAAPRTGDLLTVAFTVLDEEGQPVPDLAVTGALLAPVTAYGQHPPPPVAIARGQPSGPPGRYWVQLPLNSAGRWWAEIELTAPDGERDRLTRFIEVGPRFRIPPVESANLVFFRGARWQTYYRLDPATGLVAVLGGDEVLRAGERWLIVERRLSPIDRISPAYGGRWSLSLLLTDGQSGERIGEVPLGEVRATVQSGSYSLPALVSALAPDPGGTRLYVYWARKLGEGWTAQVTVVELGELRVRMTRELPGSLLGDRIVPQLAVSIDGERLVLAEQVVRVEPSADYRLSVLAAHELQLEASHHSAGTTTLPRSCPLTYPGLSGLSGGAELRWFTLCPEGTVAPVVRLWDPLTGRVVHQVDLSELKTLQPALATNGQTLFAVAPWTPTALAIDLSSGEVRRGQPAVTEGEDEPSPIRRILRWLIGALAPGASAVAQPSRWVAAGPEGRWLYVVAPVGGPRGYGDGVWLLDTSTLTVVDRWLVGHPIVAVTATAEGTVVAIERTETTGERALILDPTGEIERAVVLPAPISDTVVSG
jgi:hypothetical protein